MECCSERTFWFSNILTANISGNIVSHMAILSSSAAQNQLVRKPSKGSFSNVDQRVSEWLFPNDQKISEKEHGDLIVVRIGLRMIVCRKHSKCSIRSKVTEAPFCAMSFLDKFTIRKTMLPCPQRYQANSTVPSELMLL